MGLTPKETGGGLTVYPRDIEYSALLEAGYSSTGAPASTATIALSFKPTAASLGLPLSDSTGHYMLLIVKDGTTVEVFRNNVSLGSYTTSATTYAGLVSEALTAYCGSDRGYYSSLYVVEAALPWSTFFASSLLVPDLWVWKRNISVTYGTGGGLYNFSDSGALGADISGNGNDWTMTGTQSDDTPTHNGGVTAWTALDTPGVLDTSKYADVVLREGTGTPVSVGSLLFPPDFIWVKDRDTDGYNNVVFDTERGDFIRIITNGAYAETSWADSLTFATNGYELGTNTDVNAGGDAFIDLCLKAGVDQGFEIVTYTGTGTVQNISHNLGKAPTFMLVKCLSTSRSWNVYHKDLGATKIVYLDLTSAASTNSLYWNDTEPTSTQFTVGTATDINADGDEYVAYLFADSDVFQAFSYTGNGSADGPVVDLGGRPLTIPFLKNASAASDWRNIDAVRNATNPVSGVLLPNTNAAETVANTLSVRASGFKVISAAPAVNGSGNTLVGLAVMRQPYKYSNAF